MGALIVDWARSPFTKSHKGELMDIRPDEIAGQVARAVLNRNSIDNSQIDDIIVGCAYPEGEQGYNIGRIMTFLGNIPDSVPGQTINRLCGSSMEALLTATAKIGMEWGDCYLVGGIESMSRVKRRGFNWSPHPELLQSYPQAYINMGITAENVANEYKISRIQQEEFALKSHHKSFVAQTENKFNEEIIPIVSKNHSVTKDGCIRSNSSLEMMSKLEPAFIENGTVTAATSSPLTDGVVFALICSEDFCEKNSLKPIGRIISGSVSGCKPELMGLGPINSTNSLMQRLNWDNSDIDVFELNEAFASQSIACIDELKLDYEKVNIDGGAISIGHPLGASGARIACKAASILNRIGGSRALASMCIGGGMGISIAIENV